MPAPLLERDCARCAALCCVALSFDDVGVGGAFAFPKAANVVCRHVGPHNTCGIHSSLAAKGMSGCAAYDCAGAGQRVTASFGVVAAADASGDVLEAFRVVAWFHQQLQLLAVARRSEALAPLWARVDALADAIDVAADEVTPEALWRARASLSIELSALWVEARTLMPQKARRSLGIISS